MEPKVILDKSLIDKMVKEEKLDFSEANRNALKSHFNQIELNPWNVSTVDAFLYYHCPECDVNFSHDTKAAFLTHASDQHPKSHEFLSNFVVKEDYDQVSNGINEFDPSHPKHLDRYKRQLDEDELLNLSPEELCKDRVSEEYFRLTTEGDCRDVVR